MKLIMQAAVVLLIIGLFGSAFCVWPTPWVYNSWANHVYLLDPKTGRAKNLGIAAAYRESRLSGRLEAEYQGQWLPIYCGCDVCTVNDTGRDLGPPPNPALFWQKWFRR